MTFENIIIKQNGNNEQEKQLCTCHFLPQNGFIFLLCKMRWKRRKTVIFTPFRAILDGKVLLTNVCKESILSDVL